MNAPVIETSIPIPESRSDTSELGILRGTLRQMKVGQSFVWPRNKPLYDAARQTGIAIRTLKLDVDGWRCWRLEAGRQGRRWNSNGQP